MKVKLTLLLGILFLASILVYAADPTGKWVGEMQGRGGAQMVTFEFKVSGKTLTGTMTTGQGMPVEITNGEVVDADNIKFSVAGGGGGGRQGGGGGAGAPGGGGGRGPGGGAPGGAPGANFAAPQAPGGGGGGRQGGGGGAGAPGGGGGQGGGRGGQGRGGGGAANYTGKFKSATEIHMVRTPAAPAGGGAPGGGAPGGAAAPAGGGQAPAPMPVEFDVKKS